MEKKKKTKRATTSPTSEGDDHDGVENFTAFVKHSLPSLPATPEEPSQVGGTASVSAAPPLTANETSAEHHRSKRQDSAHVASGTSNGTGRRADSTGTRVGGAASPSAARVGSTDSTTGTDFYPSSGPLLRKVEDADPSLPSPHRSPRPEELPHLHDFLLQSSVSSSSAAMKRDSPSELTPTMHHLNQGNSTTLPPNAADAASKPSAVSPSQSVSRSVEASEDFSPSRVSGPHRPDASPLPVPGHPQAERPVRQMVRRHAPPPSSPASPVGEGPPPTPPPSPPVQTQVTSSVSVHEHHGVLSAAVHTTAERVVEETPNEAAGAASPVVPAEATSAQPCTPVDLLSPSFQANNYADIDAAAHAAAVAAGLSADLPIRETFPIPRYCPDDLLRGEDKLWYPGKPLRIAYVTWNMASKAPRMDEVSAYCIHPNAHLVVVGTQENGPYVGSNKLQKAWAKTVGDVCLGGQYELVAKDHMWAVQMLVFARKRDVAKYVSRAHAAHVKTGMLGGWGGNKGGVAAGLVLSLTPKFVEVSHAATTQRAVTTAPPSPRGERVPLTGAAGVRGYPTALPLVLQTEQRVGEGATQGNNNNNDDDDLQLSPSTVAGPSPPALLDASAMRHDVDDDDAPKFQCGTSMEVSNQTVTAGGTEANGGALNGDDDDDDDGVFTPAEMASRNASFDLSRERQRRRKQKRKAGHSFKRKDRGTAEQRSDDDQSDGTPDTDTPNYMSFLFITAHLAAHQGAVVNRNKDYRQIVHGLRLGRRGPHRGFFKRLLKQRRVLGDGDGAASDGGGGGDDGHWDDDSSEEDVVPLRLPVVSAIANRSKTGRDVTEEFDLTFFGGDLNYRINGTRKAIEYVIQHHRNIRSILINNDQLSLERARGTVFQGYQEGNLLFRPTYKYEVSSGNGGVTLDDYNFSRKKDRMPAYCDRVLFKKKLSSAARRVAIRLYTDVPNVRTSDHRPVVALFDVGTRAYPG